MVKFDIFRKSRERRLKFGFLPSLIIENTLAQLVITNPRTIRIIAKLLIVLQHKKTQGSFTVHVS